MNYYKKSLENYENHEHLIILCENHDREILRISYDNHENHEN